MPKDIRQFTEHAQRRSVTLSGVNSVDEAQGIVEAFVAVYDCETSYGTALRPGVFDASLARKKPKVCMGHDWTAVIGKTIEARSMSAGSTSLPAGIRDRGALYCKAQFNLDTQAGRETFSNVAGGYIDEFSVGFMPRRWEWSEDDEILYYLEADLLEWSPVLAGACPDTQTVSVMAASLAGVRLSDTSETAHAAVQEYLSRVRELLTLRAQEGRALSGTRRADVQALHAEIAALLAETEDLLADSPIATLPASRFAELNLRTLASRTRPETYQ